MKLVNHLNIKSNDWQACYSSQLYGTFFSIYAKANATYDSKDNINLKSLELKLINYKGILNLGIVQAEFQTHDKEFGGTINIEVQAKEKIMNKVIKCKNQKFKIGSTTLKFHRFLKPMHPMIIGPDGSSRMQALKEGVFDTEFFYREGIYPDRDLENETDFPDLPNPEEHGSKFWDDRNGTESDNVLGVGGILCPFSWIFLF